MKSIEALSTYLELYWENNIPLQNKKKGRCDLTPRPNLHLASQPYTH